eukprot:scaffold8843_cov76-Cyclotella_meneghiniana.AAC.6
MMIVAMSLGSRERHGDRLGMIEREGNAITIAIIPGGIAALQTIVHRLNNLTTSASQYVVTPSQCREAFDLLSEEEPTVDGRIKTFAVEAQRKSVVDVEIEILGGGSGEMLCTGRTISPPILSPPTHCPRPVCCQSPSPRHMLMLPSVSYGAWVVLRLSGLWHVEAYSGTDDYDACFFQQHNNIEALVDKHVEFLDIHMECLTCYFEITI